MTTMIRKLVSELEGAQLDWAVAKVLLSDLVGMPTFEAGGIAVQRLGQKLPFSPSTDWSQGGPIIERERITLQGGCLQSDNEWLAQTVLVPVSGPHMAPSYGMRGKTPLIAAMRAFVASKLGKEVEVPA